MTSACLPHPIVCSGVSGLPISNTQPRARGPPSGCQATLPATRAACFGAPVAVAWWAGAEPRPSCLLGVFWVFTGSGPHGLLPRDQLLSAMSLGSADCPGGRWGARFPQGGILLGKCWNVYRPPQHLVGTARVSRALTTPRSHFNLRFLGDSRPAICIFKSFSRSFQIKEAIRVATHGQQVVLCSSHEPVEEHLGAQWPGQCSQGLGAMASPPLPGFSGFI